MRRTKPFCFSFILFIFIGMGFHNPYMNAQTETDTKGKSDSSTDVSNFTLTDQNGKPFQLAQLHGKVVLLFFGYTSCPDACPTTLSKLAGVYKLIAPRGDSVVTLFVSVDPGRDTPSVLKGYLRYFRINSFGLTGTKEEIDMVVRKYGAKYEIERSDSATGYHINHSTDLYLLNQKGEVAQRFAYKDSAKLIADQIMNLLTH